VERLCATAGVSTRHFYELYDGKEDAFGHLYDELLAASERRVLDALIATEGRAFTERISAALLAYLDPMFNDLRTARIAFVEVIGLSARFEATRMRTREKLVALVDAEGRAAVGRGEVVDRDWRFGALALIGTATATAVDCLHRQEQLPVEQLERQLIALAVTLLCFNPEGVS
jgi:AcrR family transcriptional regulator